MPTYEYRCKSCGKTHEIEHGFHDKRPTECPSCGGELVRVFHVMQCGAAKYVDGVTMVGEFRFNPAFVLNHPELTSPEFEVAAPRRWTSNATSKPTDDG